MLNRNWMIVAIMLLFGLTTQAFADKTIEVKTLQGADLPGIEAGIAVPTSNDFIEIDGYISATAYHDNTSLYLALSAQEKSIDRSLREIGLALTFKGKRHEFSIRLQPAGGMMGGGHPVRIASGIEPLLPQYLNDRLRDFMPPSDYSAYLVPDKKRRSGQLIVPEFDALYQDSSAILVMRIPLENPVYPEGVLPFEKDGKLKVEVEIGDDFLSRGVMGRMGGMTSAGGRFPSNQFGENDGDRPVFGHEKFDAELLMPGWADMPQGGKAAPSDFNLSAYLEELDAWSAQSSLGGRGGFGGGRPGPGGMPPVSFQALFAGEQIVKSGIEYVSTFLDLSNEEKQKAYADVRDQWQTSEYFPVLLTMRTNMHESYLDLKRWTLFVEDEDHRQYEALKVEDVTNVGMRSRPEGEDGPELGRSVFSARMKRLVLLFPRESFSGKQIWQKKGSKMTFVMISNDHPDQRLEAEWRIPK